MFPQGVLDWDEQGVPITSQGVSKASHRGFQVSQGIPGVIGVPKCHSGPKSVTGDPKVSHGVPKCHRGPTVSHRPQSVTGGPKVSQGVPKCHRILGNDRKKITGKYIF